MSTITFTTTIGGPTRTIEQAFPCGTRWPEKREQRLRKTFRLMRVHLARFNHDRDAGLVNVRIIVRADDEPELGQRPVIASVSLGASRTFRLRHRVETLSPVSIELPHGGLMLMRGDTQRCWKHCIPQRLRVRQPRVNLTFRFVAERSTPP